MVLLPSGAIVASFPLANGFVMASIEADGKSLSSNFGIGGTVSFATGNALDLARQADGKLLVSTGNVLRLNANATTDSTFANAGTFADARISSRRAAVQRDGRIVVLGQAGAFGAVDIVLMRLWN